MSEIKINDKGDPRKYFIQIPNLIDDLDLSVYAFRLYVHLKRVAGDDGTCWQSTRTLSKECGISMGKIPDTKKELKDKGLITIEHKPTKRGGRDYHEITLVDIWQKNMDTYASSPDELASSPDELASSPHELKKNSIKNNHNKNSGSVASEFENNIQMLTPHSRDLIKEWKKHYSNDWIVEAIHIAVEQNVRKPKYINAILESWRDNGKDASKAKEPNFWEVH